MKKYKKIFFDFWGYGEQDFILCMGCEKAEAVDIHHLSPRGSGGSKHKDIPSNLAPVCRSCHWKAETNKEYNELIQNKLHERITKKSWKII